MGLDNGITICSSKRKLTRSDLPTYFNYPFQQDYTDGKVEICYARKCWGLRSDIIRHTDWDEVTENECYYRIYNPNKIYGLIERVASWLDQKTWEEDGNSIWTYDEIRPNLVKWIINLAFAIPLMELNPELYLEFYDSY